MRIYRHRQVGTLVLLALGGSAAAGAAMGILQPGSRFVSAPVVAVLLLAALAFWALTVEVTEDELVVAFGPGWFRKRFGIEEILGARVVRNPWYYGWGIRLTPHGWLYNVSGLDAVELELRGDRRFRIGTDEPERLLEAVRQAARLPA
jgi:hypothetical protein